MSAALILGGVGLLLAVWWWKSAKRRMEESLRLYFKELAEWEITNQRSQFGIEKRKMDGNTIT